MTSEFINTMKMLTFHAANHSHIYLRTYQMTLMHDIKSILSQSIDLFNAQIKYYLNIYI